MKFKPDNINPQGRSKVYFCCHPNDFDNYFENISNEILEKQKCTIWYAENQEERNDEYLSNLKETQLFVMPVTTNLLCTENVALDVEFNFAIENHIPVLPLMQEPGLENLFNQKCGDLQFLDKQNTDITAISYSDKLDKYLSSVLIGDELAEKIRAAFDAYIFLSYRKKDRKYAQELMHLIHKNDFCRDIAIWYDEFLTLGENFNDSIIQAIQKSGLFVLTVTPNLVNEKNYVMTEEYPLAKKEGKPVLPAEFVSTDWEQLCEKYEDIPPPVNAYNDVKLSEALLESIKKMAIKDKDASPEHCFFIGLAYLNGIDVEVDTQRAVELIKSSANSNLKEAMSKLVQMYVNGIGVERSLEKAIEWQNKLVELLDKEYEKNPSNKKSDTIIDENLLLGAFYQDLKKAEKSLRTYIRIEKFCLSLPNYYKTNALRIIKIYKGKGDAYVSLGDFDAAITEYKKSIDINMLNSKDIDVNAVIDDFIKIGDIYIDMGKYDKAKDLYKNSVEDMENFITSDTSVSSKRILAVAYERIATLYLNHFNDYIFAQDIYFKALNIFSWIAEETKTEQDELNLSNIYDLIANMYKTLDRNEDATSFFECSLAIRKRIAKKTFSLTSKKLLSISYKNLGDVHFNSDLSLSFSMYQKAYQIRKEIDDCSTTIETKRDLVLIHSRIAEIYVASKYYENALDHLNQALEISYELCERINIIKHQRDIAFILYSMGKVLGLQEHWEEALETLNEGMMLWKHILLNTKAGDDKKKLAMCNKEIGSIYLKLGYNDKAIEMYSNAIKLCRQVAELPNSIGVGRELCILYQEKGNAYLAKGDSLSAEKMYMYAAEGLKNILMYSSNITMQRDLAIVYERLGNLHKSCNELEKSLEQFKKSLVIRKEIVENSPYKKYFKDLFITYSKLGLIYLLKQDRENAYTMYSLALALAQKIVEEDPDITSIDDMASAYFNLGNVSQSEEQREHYKCAYEIWVNLSQKYPNKTHYRDRLNMLKGKILNG